jgi:prepilin-type processing-associated H-X9-DG protein
MQYSQAKACQTYLGIDKICWCYATYESAVTLFFDGHVDTHMSLFYLHDMYENLSWSALFQDWNSDLNLIAKSCRWSSYLPK